MTRTPDIQLPMATSCPRSADIVFKWSELKSDRLLSDSKEYEMEVDGDEKVVRVYFNE